MSNKLGSHGGDPPDRSPERQTDHPRDPAPAADGERAILERALQRILWELRPYLAELVVIGGWVPYLHQRYGPYPNWRGRLSLTAEVDVLVEPHVPTGDRPSLSHLLRAAQFSPIRETAHAAIWANDPTRGEKIEFLVPHQGTIQTLGTIVPVTAQPGLGAIALGSLEILHRHVSVLQVPGAAANGTTALVDVRVPSLGAYVLNKAATFSQRRPVEGELTNPKRAKDLLYLRDVMAGGPEVVATIERDIPAMIAADSRARHVLDAGANHLDGATRVGGARVLDEVADALAERDGTTRAMARADILGHLVDLGEILAVYRSAPATNDWVAGESWDDE